MAEAALAHRDILLDLAGDLRPEVQLRDVLSCGQRDWEVVQILESMLMRFIDREGGSFSLQVEIDKSC